MDSPRQLPSLAAEEAEFVVPEPSVEELDGNRGGGGEARHGRRVQRVWKALNAVLDETNGINDILNIPCGRGDYSLRLAKRGFRVIAADISRAHLKRAREVAGAHRSLSYVQCDARALPFATQSIDCIVCMSLFRQADEPSRLLLLHEMRRVSRRWIVLEYAHREGVGYYWWKIRRLLGLTRKRLDNLVSREYLNEELRASGLAVREIVPTSRMFSDSWVVLAEAPSSDQFRARPAARPPRPARPAKVSRSRSAARFRRR